MGRLTTLNNKAMVVLKTWETYESTHTKKREEATWDGIYVHLKYVCRSVAWRWFIGVHDDLGELKLMKTSYYGGLKVSGSLRS